MGGMTDPLDERLREILEKCVTKAYDTMDSKSWHDPFPKPIAQLRQAFADEGYLKHDEFGVVQLHTHNATNVMTGQEWYERFWNELGRLDAEVATDNRNGGYRKDLYKLWGGDIDEAAKRASGVEE